MLSVMTTDAIRRDAAWASVRDRLHERGLRWTPQRRRLIEVLAVTDGHVTGAELVERCREADPTTIPSTVYRTLDVLEELGIVRHAHGLDGREEFHVLPEREHGHLHCVGCGGAWDLEASDAASLVRSLRRQRGFAVDLSHLTVSGRCAGCESEGTLPQGSSTGSQRVTTRSASSGSTDSA
jgi:Fur family ferric uptake transcriptional regulator